MRKYGWRRQLMDIRDFKSYIPFTQRYPASVDLTSKMPAVYDQGATRFMHRQRDCGGVGI